MKICDAVLSQGWRANLELRYARQGARTILASRRHSGPLLVQKALYPEPEVCHSVILHPPAGVAGGDVLQLDVDLAADTAVLLTTPGATKWYRARADSAEQSLRFRVGAHASLEWLPNENILFDGSIAKMDTEIRLAQDAMFCGWEVYCLGRLASGESFIRGAMRNSASVFYDERLVWHDRGNFIAGDRLLDSPIGLAGKRVFGTFIAVAAALPVNFLEATRAIPAPPGSAITQLPRVWLARYLGDSTEAARDYFRALWRIVRPSLLARDAVSPRIWST